MDEFNEVIDDIGAYGFKFESKPISKKDFHESIFRYRTYKTDKDGRNIFKELPDYVRKTFNFLYEVCDIHTMADVAVSGFSHFVIHFNDNEVYQIKGMYEHCKKDIDEWTKEKDVKKYKLNPWVTKYASTNRFYEILIRYFIDKGLIDLNSKEILDYWIVPEDHWWKRDKCYKNYKYFFKGNKLPIDDCINEQIKPIAIIHEG